MKIRFFIFSAIFLNVAEFFCFTSVVHAQQLTDKGCGIGVPLQTPDLRSGATCPQVGNMGGVNLSIPTNYILGPVTYKGVDIWNAESLKNSPKHPTFKNGIDNFAIQLRQNNFKSIESVDDFDDYLKVGKTLKNQPPENRWLYASFEGRNYTGGENFEVSLKLWLKDEARRGPFIKKPNSWGLAHYISVQQPTTGAFGDQYEFFYDEKTKNTFITCENTFAKSEPFNFLSFCTIAFLLPEVKALVQIRSVNPDGLREDLVDWQKLEAGVKKMALSFIIHD